MVSAAPTSAYPVYGRRTARYSARPAKLADCEVRTWSNPRCVRQSFFSISLKGVEPGLLDGHATAKWVKTIRIAEPLPGGSAVLALGAQNGEGAGQGPFGSSDPHSGQPCRNFRLNLHEFVSVLAEIPSPHTSNPLERVNHICYSRNSNKSHTHPSAPAPWYCTCGTCSRSAGSWRRRQ